MRKLNPFNIELLFATKKDVERLHRITSVSIYEGVTPNFDPHGLFSTEIFGRLGSPERENNFAYIQLNTTVLHPIVYRAIHKLKTLYSEIMMGKSYAVFNPETKDFEVSDMITGNTGYAFFIKHLEELQPKTTDSIRRELTLDVFNKYRSKALMSNCLVLPAAFRDIVVEPDGKETQDEINDLYRKLINTSSSIHLVGAKMEDPIIDIQRRSIQNTMIEIYEYIEKMLEGKKGMIQQKWGSRRVAYGTRNVISPMTGTAEELGGVNAPHVDDTQIGLFQTLKSAFPFAIHGIRNRFSNHIFQSLDYPVKLYDKNYQVTEKLLRPDTWDKWTSTEGLERLINGFADPLVRNKPIIIEGSYLGLVYKDYTRKQFRVLINGELPPEDKKQFVTPITYGEFFYLSNYEGWYTLRSVSTRYPINNMYSIYPSRIYTKTTDHATAMEELDQDYTTVLGIAREYPDTDPKASWLNTAVPPFTRLASLGADYDGDTISTNVVYSDEAIKQIDRYLDTKGSILDAKGGFIASADTKIPARVFVAFTGEPK